MAQSASSPAREAIRGTVPKLAEIADTLIYGQIWEGPHLSKRDRSLIVCGVLMAMGRDEQLRGHLARALDNGCTKDEIAELDHPSRLLFRLADRDDRGAAGEGGVREPVALSQRGPTRRISPGRASLIAASASGTSGSRSSSLLLPATSTITPSFAPARFC